MMLGGNEPSSQQKGTGMGSGLEFFVRAFTYACAFIGAAWFGYYAYTVGFGAVDGDIIVAAGVIGGVIAAVLMRRPERRV
jgi:hypothetical protein